MLILDAHLDLSMNAVHWNRDLTRPVSEIRESESARKNEKGRATNTVSLPELRKADVGICLATLIARTNPVGQSPLDHKTQEIAWAFAQGELAYYRALALRGELRQLFHWDDVARHVAQWRADSSHSPIGFILAMEGADCVLGPDDLAQWYASGLRVIGLAHYGPGIYAHGTASNGPLTARGHELLRAMDEMGFVLDATHLADASFWDALEHFKGPVLASHNNCRTLVPGDRQFSDEQIRALVTRQAVIGAVCDAWMLRPDWIYGKTPREAVTLENLVDHMDHICQIAGNANHIAIGSDLDGWYGTEQCPADLDTIADLQKLPEILARRGYSNRDITNVMHGNWLRFFQTALADGAANDELL
jgi:membrane dipeptidase